MGISRNITRRRLMATTAAAAASPMLAGFMPEPIQRQLAATATRGVTNPWRELGGIAIDAGRAGLPVPHMSFGVTGGTGFDEVMPSVLEFLRALESAAQEKAGPEVEALINRAADLLQRLTAAERMPRQDREPGTGLASAVARPVLDDKLRKEYETLFKTCEPRESYRSIINKYVSQLKDEDNRKRYAEVANAVCAPWYFIAIIHAMEASFNFRAHLHNGDPLSRKTWQVPANRPPVWNPPNDWASSAIDAIKYDGFADQTDWSLAATLYRWEGYNGWRSRTLHKINTPYLWSFSNHYTKGKYVRDNVWDPDAVSKQCGGAVMFKVLVDEGLIPIAS